MLNRLHKLQRSKFVRDTLFMQSGRITTMVVGVLALMVVIRVIGLEGYGVWKLVVAFIAIWQTLEISGVGMNTSTRLAIAVGKEDGSAVLDLMAYYVKMTLGWSLLTVLVLFLAGPAVSARLYGGDTTVGQLAAWFSLSLAADALYTLVVLALRSRRLMRQYVLLQTVNQLVLFLCVVVAVVLEPTAAGMVAGRVVYSYATMTIAVVVYMRLRGAGPLRFPPLLAVLGRALGVPFRPYWRSGVAMAVDKNLAALYTQIPITLVGVFAGPTAAGYLGTGLDLINRADPITGPVLENMQAVVPISVGRGDFVGLRRNFRRVLLAMAAAGVAIYGAVAVLAPLIVPLLFGTQAAPAVPVAVTLALYGIIAAAGGLFGPMYRALDLMRSQLLVKLGTALVMLPVGIVLIQTLGALGGAWTINGLYGLSVVLTAAVTLPALGRRAGRQRAETVATL